MPLEAEFSKTHFGDSNKGAGEVTTPEQGGQGTLGLTPQRDALSAQAPQDPQGSPAQLCAWCRRERVGVHMWEGQGETSMRRLRDQTHCIEGIF